MPKKRSRDREEAVISKCLAAFEANRKSLELYLEQIALIIGNSSALAPFVHTLKTRIKSTSSLNDKLHRKLEESRKEKKAFHIAPENLFETVNDLVGVRILHLHRGQLRSIDAGIRQFVEEQEFRLLEVFARTWDDRSREFFRSLNIPTELSPTMYTSGLTLTLASLV
jgi:putative GTP pyrophosphokinase